MDVQLPQTTQAPTCSDASENFWRQLVQQNHRTRRNYPRIHADISVHVLGVQTRPIKLHSRDISFGGLQIRCNPETSRQLLDLKPETVFGRNNSDPPPVDDIKHMKLELRLVVGSRVHKVQCFSRVAHYVHVPDALHGQEIAIGFQFLGFKDQGKQILSEFIEEHLIPAGF